MRKEKRKLWLMIKFAFLITSYYSQSVNIKQQYNFTICQDDKCATINASNCEGAKTQAKAQGIDFECSSEITVKTDTKINIKKDTKVTDLSSLSNKDKIEELINKLNKNSLDIDNLKDIFNELDKKIGDKFEKIKNNKEIKADFKESIVQDIKNEFEKLYEKVDNFQNSFDSKVEKIKNINSEELKDAITDLNSKLNKENINIEDIKKTASQLESIIDKKIKKTTNK